MSSLYGPIESPIFQLPSLNDIDGQYQRERDIGHKEGKSIYVQMILNIICVLAVIYIIYLLTYT